MTQHQTTDIAALRSEMRAGLEGKYRLHDQGDDALDHRYSIFHGDEIVLLFNLPVFGPLKACDVVAAFNAADALDAAEREKAEAVAAEREECRQIIMKWLPKPGADGMSSVRMETIAALDECQKAIRARATLTGERT